MEISEKMHITFFDDKSDPVTEHNWIFDAITHLYNRHGIDLICTRESGISSLIQNTFGRVNILPFNKKSFYLQDPEEIRRISVFTGQKKSIIWVTSHFQDETTPMKIWNDIASQTGKHIRLAIKTATIRKEFTRENYYPDSGRFVGGILAASKTTKAELIQAFNLPPEHIHVVYIGIGLDIFDFNKYESQEEIRQSFGFEKDDCIIGSVGSLVQRKGHHLVIDAFSQLAGNFKNARLVIVGRGDMERKLRKQCEEKKLTSRINFLGYFTQMAKIMKMCDILVLASDREGGIPRVITEALGMKTPVISVSLGAIPEIIHNGINGFLLKQRNAKAIEEKLRILLSSQKLLASMKQAAYESIQPFDRTIWLNKLEESFLTIWNRG